MGQQRQANKPRRGIMPSYRQMTSGLAVVLVVAVSGMIATRERPYRSPVQVVDVTPVERADLPPADEPASNDDTAVNGAEDAAASEGPSIIQVKPREKPSNSVIVIRDPSEIGQDLRVAHLPDNALIEKTAAGPLPVRASDGRRPFDVYARPWSGTRGARVAIIIGGLGLSQTGTQSAIAKLPSSVTLAFAPHGNSIGRWMQTARREGHEIMMQVPMEPFDYPQVNPGENTLTVGDSAQSNVEKLHWSLARTTNYTGVMNYMGARYLADKSAMGQLMQELGKRGLMFLDDGTSARSVAAELALPDRVPFAAGDTVIDTERSRNAILKKLDELENTARARGYAVGTGSAFGETVEAVASWVKEARRRGIEIVPVSAIAVDPERR